MKLALEQLAAAVVMSLVLALVRLGVLTQEYPPPLSKPALPPPPQRLATPAADPLESHYANPFEPLFEIRTIHDVAALGCWLGEPLRRGQA